MEVVVSATPQSYFEERKLAFINAIDTAVSLSGSVADRRVEQRLAWASWIFARLCATGHSIKRLLIPITSAYGTAIDHASIGNLSRNIIEASILVSYLTESGVSDEEWACRRLALHLHDCVARVRLFKGLGPDDKYEKHKQALEELRARLSKNAYFEAMTDDARAKVSGGGVLYLHGLRSAAQVAGWDKDYFDAIYSYLSAQTHSSPMSFYRMDDRGIDNRSIAPYQFGFVGFALEHATKAAEHATERILESLQSC